MIATLAQWATLGGAIIYFARTAVAIKRNDPVQHVFLAAGSSLLTLSIIISHVTDH